MFICIDSFLYVCALTEDDEGYILLLEMKEGCMECVEHSFNRPYLAMESTRELLKSTARIGRKIRPS